MQGDHLRSSLKNILKQGRLEEAIFTLYSDVGSYVKPSSYICLLQGCITTKKILQGRLLHLDLIENVSPVPISVWTTLVDMYCKCGELCDARAVFDSISQPNVVTWTAIIAGYAREADDAEEALILFREMHADRSVVPNNFTFLSVINACANLVELATGRLVHAYLIRNGVTIDDFLGNALMNMYNKFSELKDVLTVFHAMTSRDVVAWTILITAYADHGLVDNIFQLYQQMACEGFQLDAMSLVSILSACTNSESLHLGRQLHACVNGWLISSTSPENALIDMYCRCGSIGAAYELFQKMHIKDVTSWNMMFSACAKFGAIEQALKLYGSMHVLPNRVTFISILKFCSKTKDLDCGRCIHMEILCSGRALDVSLGNSVVDFYVSCESFEDARKVFDELICKDVISWTTIITGYSQNENIDEAMKLFHEMEKHGILPNEVTFLSIISVCSSLGNLEQGMIVHSKIVTIGKETEIVIANALTDMYAKCGDINCAHIIFGNVCFPDTISWNSIISGYALHGCVSETLTIARNMLENKFRFNDVTSLGVLSACCRTGLLDEGLYTFHSIINDNSVMLTEDHLVCMVDLLARMGHMQVAVLLMMQLPVDTTSIVCRALLSACKVHCNIDMATYIFETMLECEQHDASAFVLFLNVFAGEFNTL